MKKLLILLVLLFSSCASFHLSTLNHDPIYDTVLVVSSDTQVDTLNEFQFRNKLRNDFNFRYDFARYALSQPRSFDWNNRILGNRYNVYNPYYGFGYNNYWNRDQMWNDWVWGYPYSNGIGWSYSWRNNSWSSNSWNNHYGWNNYYGWNNWNGWGNGYGYNAWHQIYGRQQNVAHNTGRRGSTTTTSRIAIKDKIALGKLSKSRLVTNKPTIINKPVILNKPLVINTKPRINNSRPIFNNSKPIINNSRPTFNNNSRSNTTIRTIPNNPTRSSSNPPTRGNSRKNN